MDAINPKVDPYLLSQLFIICDLRNLSDPSLGFSFVTTTYTRYNDSPHDHLEVQATFHGRSRNTLDPYLALDLLYNYLSIT